MWWPGTELNRRRQPFQNRGAYSTGVAPSLGLGFSASFLVRKGTDVKTVQKMLRHSDGSTTLGIHAHSMSEDRLAAQVDTLTAMMTPSNAVN